MRRTMDLDRPSTRREQLRENRERGARRNQVIWAIAGAAMILIIAIAAICFIIGAIFLPETRHRSLHDADDAA